MVFRTSESVHASAGVHCEVLRGAELQKALECELFVLRWNKVYAQCGWSTPYQSFDYVKAWYRCYGDLYEPLAVVGYSSDGSLSGVLALARCRNDGRMVPVGTTDATYTSWLADAACSDQYIEAALDLLVRHYPRLRLTLCLAPGTPIDWTGQGKRWGRRCVLVTEQRPIMQLTMKSIRNSQKKRNNRNRFNRIQRQGLLEFYRIQEADGLSRMLNDVAPHYDLRRVALFGLQPMRDDVRKFTLFVELLRARRLHATVSTVGGEVISAMIGLCHQEVFYLDFLCHSPMFTAQSPGKLHLLALAELLVNEGYKCIDLTPGVFDWKDRSATSRAPVHEVIICFSRFDSLRTRVRTFVTRNTKQVARRACSWVGFKPSVIKSAVRRLADLRLPGIAARVIETIVSPRLESFSRYSLGPSHSQPHLNVRKDALDDLFLFTSTSNRLRRTFLRSAYERLCAGEHVYTHVVAGRLMGLCWARPMSSQGEHEEAASFLLHDPYFHPAADRESLSMAIVQTIATCAGSQFLVQDNDRELIAAFDKLRVDRHSASPSNPPIQRAEANIPFREADAECQSAS